MDGAFHDQVEIGDGITVYELDDTYSGMIALKGEMDSVFGERCEFQHRMNILNQHRLSNRLGRDPYSLGAYMDWNEYSRPEWRKHVAFRDGRPYAIRFDDRDSFFRLEDMHGVKLPGTEWLCMNDSMLHNRYGGSLRELAVSDDPARRFAAASATTWHGDMMFRGDRNFNMDVATELWDDPDWRVRRALALNPVLHPSMLETFVDDPDWRVRIATYDALWRNGVLAWLDIGMDDDNDDIRMFVGVLNGSRYSSSDSRLAKDRCPVVRALHALYCSADDIGSVLSDIDDVQYYLFINPNVGVREMQRIAEKSKSEQIRAEALMWLASYEEPVAYPFGMRGI